MRGGISTESSPGPLLRTGSLAALAAIAAACGSSAERSQKTLTCAPSFYIEGDACLPLQIGAPADATVDSNSDSSQGSADEVTDEEDSPTAVDASAAGDDGPGLVEDAWLDAPSLTCDGGESVPECVEYYAYLDRCFSRTDLLAFACQDTLLAKADADVASIVALCLDNLQRLMSACR